MKKIFTLFLVLCYGAFTLSAKELKVLMIGNSFSLSVLTYLPRMVAAGKVHKLKLGSGYIGSCSLERHCKNFETEKTRPRSKPYSFTIAGEKSRRATISDMVKSDKWDIITIQQSSTQSLYKDKTQGYGKKLIAYLKKLAPQAEIVVHQTWAYHPNHYWFVKKGAKLTQKQMHDMLTANYTELAGSNKLRMIPMGNAVQLFREKLPVKRVKIDSAKIRKLKRPAVLDLSGGDVVGRMYWRKNRKTGKYSIVNDWYHLNDKGQYFQACVWYMFLFDAKAADIKLPFKGADAALMKECAAKAVAAVKK